MEWGLSRESMSPINITSTNQLNALIAERVFYLVVRQDANQQDFYYVSQKNGWDLLVPGYTYDMGAAWEIVVLFADKDISTKRKFIHLLQTEIIKDWGNDADLYDLVMAMKPMHIAIASLRAMDVEVQLSF